MASPIRPIASTLQALSQRYETITHNLANVDTTGFKRTTTSFQEVLSGKVNKSGSGSGSQSIKGINTIDFTQGGLTKTGGPLDLALMGKGFFVIETPQGPLYTRNGSFRLNSQGQLTDGAGRLVAGDSGPIVLPGTSGVTIAGDGTISVDGQTAGKIKIVDFENYKDLQSVGGSSFRSKAQTILGSTASIQQGHRENSNVTAVQELVNLITVTRMYQANMRGMQVAGADKFKSLMQAAMA